jgi:hypothetical protein
MQSSFFYSQVQRHVQMVTGVPLGAGPKTNHRLPTVLRAVPASKHPHTLGLKEALPWGGMDRLTVFVIDQSGSMRAVNESVRAGAKAAGAACAAAGMPVHYVVFDDSAGDGASLDGLPSHHGGTDIACAFHHLNALLLRHGTPKQLNVVFVSDGEDSRAAERMAAFAPLGPETRFLTVGVKEDFPFNLVFQILLPVFGRGNNKTMPPVFPLDVSDDAAWIFEEVVKEIFREGDGAPPSMEPFRGQAEPSLDLINKEAIKAYNVCMQAVFVGMVDGEQTPAQLADKYDALDACARFMGEAMLVVRDRARHCKFVGVRAEVRSKQTITQILLALVRFNDRVKKIRENLQLNIIMDQNFKRTTAGLAGRLVCPPVVYMPRPAALCLTYVVARAFRPLHLLLRAVSPRLLPPPRRVLD